MFRQRARRSEGQGIDISPLIDMVFILLIFFMVSTTFAKDMDLDIDRPDARSAERADSESLRLYIDKGGETYLGGEPVRTWMIQSRVRDRLATSTTDGVLVIADETVPTRRLIEVVDQVRLAGGNPGVATRSEAGGP
jgi:biopolymer transport protein ExbD